MSKFTWRTAASWLVASVLAFIAASPAFSAEKKPNILVIWERVQSVSARTINL